MVTKYEYNYDELNESISAAEKRGYDKGYKEGFDKALTVIKKTHTLVKK